MKLLKSVEWSWNSGKVFSKFTYRTEEIEVRYNKEPPPTKASHDIAHFICGFHEDLEWDYQSEPNHYAEYNAVFVECILYYFCFYRNKGFNPPIDEVSKTIHNHMKWFSREHYHIHKNHPGKKDYLENQKIFLSKLDSSILEKYFRSYFKVWAIEQMMGNCEFNISIEMDDKSNFSFKPLNTYITELKMELLDKRCK